MHKLRNGSKGRFKPGLSRLKVRHSTAELLRSKEQDAKSLVGVMHQQFNHEDKQSR